MWWTGLLCTVYCMEWQRDRPLMHRELLHNAAVHAATANFHVSMLSARSPSSVSSRDTAEIAGDSFQDDVPDHIPIPIENVCTSIGLFSGERTKQWRRGKPTMLLSSNFGISLCHCFVCFPTQRNKFITEVANCQKPNFVCWKIGCKASARMKYALRRELSDRFQTAALHLSDKYKLPHHTIFFNWWSRDRTFVVEAHPRQKKAIEYPAYLTGRYVPTAL